MLLTRVNAKDIVDVMLRLTNAAYTAMLAHAYDGLPFEACGLLIGRNAPAAAGVDGSCVRFAPTENDAQSSKVYTVSPKQHLRIERDAEDEGLEVIGVMHSHTHTDAYPSPTDVAQAPDPSWHYVIVSLRDDAPVLRSYLIANSTITEEPVVLVAYA